MEKIENGINTGKFFFNKIDPTYKVKIIFDVANYESEEDNKLIPMVIYSDSFGLVYGRFRKLFYEEFEISPIQDW